MLNRIIGEEIEWEGGYRPGPDGVWSSIGVVFDKIVEVTTRNYKHCFAGNQGIFLPNGARAYFEATGQHFETATPECSSAREALKFDKWSELFVCWLAKELKENYGIDLVFYKKNADSSFGENTTRGCHESYFSEKQFGHSLSNSEEILRKLIMVGKSASINPEINYLILFLITRQIFTGSGGIMLHSLKNEKDVYEISPKTNYIQAIISAASTSSSSIGRPIVHVRKESLSHDDKYFRNHLILGDANMADLSIFLKFGTTSAVLE